jgi:aminoglycoside phosphotransferase (APT) family kinase protein
MSAGKMHADEADIDVSLVGRLLAAQFPQWAGLPVEPVRSAGTDNAIYRLGGDMAVRLPASAGARQVEKEHSGCQDLPVPCQNSCASSDLVFYMTSRPLSGTR